MFFSNQREISQYSAIEVAIPQYQPLHIENEIAPLTTELEPIYYQWSQ